MLLPTRAVSLVITAAILSTLVMACSPQRPAAVSSATQASVAVQAGNDAELAIDADESLTVNIPGESLDGEGTLTVEATTGPGDVQGWNIELSGGAKLVGPATLRFAHEFADGEPPPVITSTSDGSTYTVTDDVSVDSDGVTVTTTHFSFWHPVWWDKVLDFLRKRLDKMFAGSGSPPSCTDETGARTAGYGVTSDSGSSVYWCLGMQSSGTPRLKLVNGRGYTVAVENTPGLTMKAGWPSDLATAIASVIKDAPSKAGNQTTLVAPGDTIEFDVVGKDVSATRAQPSVAGYLTSVAMFGIDTLDMILPYVGKGSMAKEALAKLFDWGVCFAGFADMATTDIQTARQAGDYLTEATGTVLGCVGDALTKAGLNFWGVAFASVLSWLISGVKSIFNGLGAAADTALNPHGYQVTVTPPSTPSPSSPAPTSAAAPPTTPPPAEVPGWPAELQGKWCARSGNTCFSLDSLLAQYPEAFLENSSPDPDVPGTTQYAICTAEEFANGCTMAATIYLQVFPVGIAWDCIAVADPMGFPGCEPDYSADHDTSEPRIVVRPSHQHDTDYQDSPPLYRV